MNALTAESLSVQQLRPHPKNVRREVTPSEELVASVKAHGILQPLLVTPHPVLDGDYLVIAGHHRLAAAKKAGLLNVPCMVNETLGDEAEQLAVMLVENLQRTDLTVGEEAKAYQALLEFPGWTEAKIAKRTGRAKDTVRGRVKLAGMGEAAITAVEGRRASLEDVLKLADAGLSEERQAEALAGPRVDAWEINSAIGRWEKEQAAPALVEELRGQGLPVVDRAEIPDGANRIWTYYQDDLDRYDIQAVVVDAESRWEAEYHGKLKPTAAGKAQAPQELTEEQQADAARRAELEAGLKIARRVHEEQVRTTIRTEKTIENGRARQAITQMCLDLVGSWGAGESLADWLEVPDAKDKDAIAAALARLNLGGIVLAYFACQRLYPRSMEGLEDLDDWDGRGGVEPLGRAVSALAVLGSELSDVEREAIDYWNTQPCGDCDEVADANGQCACDRAEDEEADDDDEA
ncbi:ParB/RepB/Spo0J family partition protein [Sinomonas soli]